MAKPYNATTKQLVVGAKLSAMRDVAALEALFDRVLEVETWDELMSRAR